MRITMFVGRPDLGGGARVISIYAERLQQRGHEVTVYARPPRKATFREKLRSKVKGIPLPAPCVPSRSYFENREFRFQLLPDYRPATPADVPDADVVIGTWWETAEWVAGFPASKGAKVYFVQHYETFGGDAARVDATWRAPAKKICVAQWLADLARERFGDSTAVVVPNAVDLDQFNAPARGKQTRPTVGVMYSTVAFKGCDVSLRAFELAKAKLPDLQLISFGAIDPDPRLPLPEGAEYRWQPPQDQIKDYYARCDAWLFGSRSEGFGLPLLEAMACRTPVIATPAGAAPELIAPGGGELVPMEDPAAMADAIVRVCTSDNATWRGLSDRAYAAASRYTWDDAAARFEAVLLDVAARKEPQARPLVMPVRAAS